jgi:hypothetical protein
MCSTLQIAGRPGPGLQRQRDDAVAQPTVAVAVPTISGRTNGGAFGSSALVGQQRRHAGLQRLTPEPITRRSRSSESCCSSSGRRVEERLRREPHDVERFLTGESGHVGQPDERFDSGCDGDGEDEPVERRRL